MPLRPSAAGGAGSFLVLADDGRRYWCKALNNFQSPRVPITEQLVARLGALIGAPVCVAQLVLLDDIAGWEIRPGSGRLVEPGWAHGSLAVEPAIETRSLEYRRDDDNARRHAGLLVLSDWLLGGDLQWLRALDEDNAYHSHDHGFFLTGPDWTAETLRARQNEPVTLSVTTDYLDRDELAHLAERLEGMTREEIDSVLSKLPAGWPVTDDELEQLAEVVDARCPQVVGRLRTLVA